ncbi:putative Sad1 / UNC-like C-terminal [Blattamonas nauphoetae]|uniref:Sad1 / UNC-like C-terminal n=1 Tax=Blattamonas nauphoetae TaxID=2049346 RepID=A0ABQ9Y3M4_9EUKA|nr:putative Sad1 / UNC-like C-terminal [Blattamonas nauphoetae]
MRPKHLWTQIASRGRKREEARTAQVILDPSLELGSCLPLSIHQNKSSPAFVTIDLLRKFNVQAVSLSHSPSSSALLQSRLSAPAHFQVFCDDNIASNSSHVDLSSNHSPNQTRIFLGEGHYDFGKTTKQNTTQTFYMAKSSHEDTYQPCRHVRVELLSNHGDLDFVCLYNVQVHPDLTEE